MTMMATPLEEYSRSSEEIDRLALRISLADDDEQFEKVVQKSLIYMLKCVALYEDHRKKLMELLGDVTRRLKARPNIQVPVRDLFLTYNDQSNLIFLSNFSHMYLRLGYPRLPLSQQIKFLPLLFTSLTEDKPVFQRDSLLHLTLPFIGSVTPESVPRDIGLSELPMHRRFITDFYSLVLLTPYSLQRLVRFDSSDSVIPDGFNSYDLSRVVHDRFSSIGSADDLEKYKLGLIQFYSRHFFPAEESIIPILFGYGDTRHSVVSTAAKELRTLSMIVDWEDEILLSRLLTWYLGRRREFDPKGRTELRRPLSPTMRIKLGHYLLRSRITLPGLLAPSLVEAALLSLETASMSPVSHTGGQPQMAPAAPPPGPPVGPDGQHVCDGSCGNHPPQSTRQPTEENSNPPATLPRSATTTTSLAQRKRLAEHGLDLLAHLINNVTTLNGPASVAALRCLINFVYEKTVDELTVTRARGFELLSRFLTREPNYLLKDPAQLPRLFDVLSEDNPTEVKIAAANCLRRLAVTFQDAQRQNFALRSQLGKLERLLYENIEKPDPLCRLVSVNFAGLIYPSDHIPTRYLILQALGDKDQHVRKEACMAFEQFLDPNIIHDIVYGRVKLPSFVEFVNHDTQHSKKNPFVEVERLVPVVQFIRLCLLATRGALTPAQEAGLTYETEDEVRYLVNQTVRYFLSIGSSSTSPSSGSNTITSGSATSASPGSSTAITMSISPEQAKRSIDTYFRLIQVVIFTRPQHAKESPNFPNYLEEVLVGNTKELITCNKQLFDRINNVLLATSRGVNCRHACASVYSVVVMETEPPSQALQAAKKMLSSIPLPSSHIDGENSHMVQGMFMGAAYLLERLFSRHVAIPTNGTPGNQTNCATSRTISSGAGTEQSNNPSNTSSKKGKRERQQQSQQQKQLRADIMSTIEHFTNLMSSFLVKPGYLIHNPSSNDSKDKRSSESGFYSSSAVAQATVASLLDSLMIVLRAGCLSHLPEGSLPVTGNAPSLSSSKAAIVHRIGCYLSLPLTSGTNEVSSGHLHVAQAAIRALAACCMGEGVERVSDSSCKSSKDTPLPTGSHPHTIGIMKMLLDTAEINDPSLHLAVGVSLADCLLGPASPLKKHWYERVYPLTVDPDALEAAVSSPAGLWLARHLENVLTLRTGQTRTRPITLAAALWTLALVRRTGPLPSSFLPDRLIIDLLEDRDESVQCVAVATLGQIYDRSGEDARHELVTNLTKAIVGNEKRQVSTVYRELCSLAHQIGRPDLALSLIVLAIAPSPNTRLFNVSGAATVGSSVATSVTYAGLVRRLGRALASALPRLVPRIFVRRFDYARPKLRQAIENLWLGLISYASNSTTLTLPCITSCSSLALNGTQLSNSNQQQHPGSSCVPSSVHALSSEMIEAHFNAIICEIKTQLGFNTLNVSSNVQQLSAPLTSSDSTVTTQCVLAKTVRNAGTQDHYLRDACCLAIANLTTHPAADKRLAGHLPALLSGLLGLCDESNLNTNGPSTSSRPEGSENSRGTTPPEEAAIAVQKLVIRVLENPCSREAAAGLLPGLLPVIIDRAPWTYGSATDPDSKGSKDQVPHPPSESRRLALELLLAATRTARPSALRPALPQLVLAGLQTMSSVHPSLVASLMRQSIHHLYQLYSSAGYISPAVQSSGHSASVVTSTSSSTYPSSVPPCMSSNREIQMAEILRLCVRLIDDVCLSRLIVPFTELIRAGGTQSTTTTGIGTLLCGTREAAAVATATCVFISHLAAANISALAASNSFARNNTCLRCSSSALGLPFFPEGTEQSLGESPNVSPSHRLPPCSVQSPPSPIAPTSSLVSNSSGIGDSLPNTVTSTSETANRYRIPPGSLKHGASLSTLSGSGGPVVNGPSITTTGGGGGLASLIPHTGKLLAALLSALPGACKLPESAGKITQIEMARALANLLRFAKSTSVAKLFNRVRSWYLNPETATCCCSKESSSASISHWACARVMHAVAHQCPELLFVHAGVTLPLIFLNRQLDTEGTDAIVSQLDRAAPQLTVLPAGDTTRDGNELSNTKATRSSSTQIEIFGESASLQQLWQETWEQIMCKISSSSGSIPTLWPTSALHLFIPTAYGFVTNFLRPPLLDPCLQLLQDALLDSPCWSVRTQASTALLHLASRLIGQPVPASNHFGYFPQRMRNTRHPHHHRNRLMQNVSKHTSSHNSSQSDATIHCIPSVNNVEDLGKKLPPIKQYSSSSDKDEESEVDAVCEEESLGCLIQTDDHEEWAYQAWASLIQLTARVLSESKPWPDKACLLRATRLLAVYARERGLATEEANEEIVNQLWCSLVHETKVKQSENVTSGYRAEAFLSLASLAEASGRNVLLDNELLAVDENEEENADCLLSLSRLLVPDWSKSDKSKSTAMVNPELNDSELELAVRALGILWPVGGTDEHLSRFPGTISLLNFLILHNNTSVQSASLASVLGILAKLTPEQSKNLVEGSENSTICAKSVLELCLKDLLLRIKRAAGDSKSQLLREHALGCIAALLRHTAFTAILREQLVQTLQVFSNDSVSSLRDCAADLRKSLIASN